MRSAELGLPAWGGGLAAPPPPARANGAAGAVGDFGALYRQLDGEVRRFIEQGGPALAPAPQPRPVPQADAAPLDGDRQAFLQRIAPLAEDAGARLGVAPEVLAAQAALESGWGRQPLRHADGSDSHNLFGIKATGGWRGDVVASATTEIEQGQAQQRTESFRAYAGPGQAFDDLTRLLLNSPRYRAALGTGADAAAYGQALQQGGYATDPAYAAKLARVAAQIKRGD